MNIELEWERAKMGDFYDVGDVIVKSEIDGDYYRLVVHCGDERETVRSW